MRKKLGQVMCIGGLVLMTLAACGSPSNGIDVARYVDDQATLVAKATSPPVAVDADNAADATPVVTLASPPIVDTAAGFDVHSGTDDCNSLIADSLASTDELGISAGLYMDAAPDLSSCLKPTPEPWPTDFIFPVNDVVHVRFPYDTYGSRLSNILVWHIPSNGYIQVDSEGHVVSIRRMPSAEALDAVCEVLADESVMAGVYAGAHELYPYFVSRIRVVPAPCDASEPSVVTGTPTTSTPEELEAFFEQRRFKSDSEWPEDYRLTVSEDVEIRYSYPVGNQTWYAPIEVRHIATSEIAEVNLDGQIQCARHDIDPDALQAICAVLSDESLMDGVIDRAVEIGVYWTRQGPVESNPCETLHGS